MGLHYHKHQQTYLNNLNKLLQKNNYSYNYTEEELINHINVFPKTDQENIHFNLGDIINLISTGKVFILLFIKNQQVI